MKKLSILQKITLITLKKGQKTHKNVIVFADNHADFLNSATNWISKNILHKIIWRYYAQMLVPYVKKFYGVLPARVDFLKEVYNIPSDMWYGEDHIYEDLIEKATVLYPFEKHKDKYPQARKMLYPKSRIDITPYGQLFYNICVKN